jgi:hypothetical protein
MEVDAETGYIQTQRNDVGGKHFTAEKKISFLKSARDFVTRFKKYPPMHELAASVGTTLRTVQTHLKDDHVFKQDFREILNELQVIYTQKLGDKADLKQGTLANLAMLRYLESGTWNPGGLNPISQLAPTKEILTRFNDCIDAEIVPEPPQITSKNNP